MRILALVLSSFIAIGCASTHQKPQIHEYGGLSILQGHTTESTTQFTVVVPIDTVYEYVVQPESPGANEKSGTPADIVVSASRTIRNDSNWGVDAVAVTGLKEGSYILFVKNTKTNIASEKRFFETLNPKQKFDFIIASCLDDAYPEIQQSMWPQAMTHDPDAIFMIGDNVYADKFMEKNKPTPPAEVWNRYVQTRKRLDVFFWERLVPIYAVWDDHDFGQNDGNKTYPHLAQSKEIFDTFFAQKADERILKQGPGVAFSLDLFDQRFIFLDGRSFQDPKDVVGKKLYGATQETWALDNLSKPTRFAWLISGLQFFGGYHRFESFEGSFKEDFEEFKTKLKTIKNKFVLVSGDRHLFEVMQIPASLAGQDTFEITTSAMHAIVFPDAWKDNPNPLQISGASGKHNYVLIKTVKKENKIVPTLEAYSINESLLKKEL